MISLRNFLLEISTEKCNTDWKQKKALFTSKLSSSEIFGNLNEKLEDQSINLSFSLEDKGSGGKH